MNEIAAALSPGGPDIARQPKTAAPRHALWWTCASNTEKPEQLRQFLKRNFSAALYLLIRV